MTIAILGRKEFTGNYERFIESMPAIPGTTLSPDDVKNSDALILPGGGDITPAFFGERNSGSSNIDTELDILQLQAIDCALREKIPILGICKGMQLINVSFGGTIIQDIETADIHKYTTHDKYHDTEILKGSVLYDIYGKNARVNSAHHQAVGKIGKELIPIQWCTNDRHVEAIQHKSLPILGVQWHPERLSKDRTPISGQKLLTLLSFWIYETHRGCTFQKGL